MGVIDLFDFGVAVAWSYLGYPWFFDEIFDEFYDDFFYEFFLRIFL